MDAEDEVWDFEIAAIHKKRVLIKEALTQIQKKFDQIEVERLRRTAVHALSETPVTTMRSLGSKNFSFADGSSIVLTSGPARGASVGSCSALSSEHSSST